ncbi:type II toxin-antitoxin system RelE family toxin [Azospirillum halopraeferens]|uniref:type II toxin-antitoxin system RelE family toxin n=1 Tax=Azospirillum halopraeferens TaxID=34010 RepID=UPI00041EE6CD|nr:type II toxin-antitoxin system RelE/ParE family toxin [Azospirillum halopraeferens]
MRLELHKQVVKALGRVQPKLAQAILSDLKAIAAEPFGRHPNVKALRDRPDYFRYRHAGWRVLYRIDRNADTMFAEHMDTRGDIY